MQIVCKCKHCGHIFISDNDADLCVEFDAMEEEIRFVCRNGECRKNNTISFRPRKEIVPLPRIVVSR
jgi:hypothetical protein